MRLAELQGVSRRKFRTTVRDEKTPPAPDLVERQFTTAGPNRFYATLECELLDRHRLRTHIDARLAVFDFIEGWYNPRRRHSALEYQVTGVL